MSMLTANESPFARKLYFAFSTRSSRVELSVFHPATDLRRLRQNALSCRRRRGTSRRKALAWVAATWVVINCDKAQTRHTRNIHTSLSLSLSVLSSRMRKAMCIGAPACKMHVHARTRLRCYSGGLWITCACMRVGATWPFSRSRGISIRE